MHEDFYRPPLDLAVTEDATDAVALQVAEPSFAGVAVTPEGSKSKAGAKIGNEEEGEQAAPVEVAYTEQNLSRYEDPTSSEEQHRLTIEEFVLHSSRDSKATRACKTVVNELLTRSSCSRYTAAIDGSLPSTCDYVCDVMLCARRSLSPVLYRLFCRLVETQFEGWHRLDEKTRHTITESVGSLLLSRGIVRGGRTSSYWYSGYKQRGFALAKAA